MGTRTQFKARSWLDQLRHAPVGCQVSSILILNAVSPSCLFQHVSTPILFASIPTFFACRTASFLVFYIPKKKYIWNRRLFKKRKLNPLSSSQLISSTPACDLAMLPPKLGSRNSGCQRLRCRVASSRTPGSSTAGAAGAAGAAAGALVGAGTWENAAEIHGFAIVSGQPFVGQLIWC